MKRFFIVLLLIFINISGIWAQKNLEEGKQFYEMQDYGRALPFLQAAAKEGYPEAMYLVGNMYYYGQGVKQDYTIALRMYQRCVPLEYAEGIAMAGFMYENGNGVAKDVVKAVEYYRKAAEAGSYMGMMYLGACYYNGNGVEKNYNEALPLLMLSGSYYYYARLLTAFIFDECGYIEWAYNWYRSVNNYPYADYRIAMIRYYYRDPNPNSHINDPYFAAEAMQKAIDGGFGGDFEKFMTAVMLDDGRIDRREPITYLDYAPGNKKYPVKYLEQAAKNLYGPALCLLGKYYNEGLYTARNPVKANECFKQALANVNTALNEETEGLSPAEQAKRLLHEFLAANEKQMTSSFNRDRIPIWSMTRNPDSTLKVGDQYLGGVIFYLDGKGHGAVAGKESHYNEEGWHIAKPVDMARIFLNTMVSQSSSFKYETGDYVTSIDDMIFAFYKSRSEGTDSSPGGCGIRKNSYNSSRSKMIWVKEF